MLAGLALVLGTAGVLVSGKERVLERGTTMLVELAPVDPRSLMQGDYMVLDYAISRQLLGESRGWARTGEVVVRLDGAGVARFVRRHAGERLAPGEHLLRYRRRGGRVRIGTDAFHFQEGTAERYARARYGELKVAKSGESVLVALRDSAAAMLGRAR